MKAKSKVQEAPVAPQAVPGPQGIVAPEFYDPNQPWMAGTWSDLVKMVNNPEPGHAYDVFHLAFRRTETLTSTMTIVTHSGVTEDDWGGLADTIELNACIMRQAFEIVFDAWQKSDKSPITE